MLIRHKEALQHRKQDEYDMIRQDLTSCLIVTSHDIIHERNKTEGMTCLVRMPTNDLPARASAAATLAQGKGGFLILIF